MELKKADDKTKLAATRELMRECYQAGYSKDIIHTLIKFLVWVIRPSKEYDKELKEEIKKIEEDLNMEFMLPWEITAEKRGRRKGRQEGRQEGLTKGLVKGRIEGIKETALRMLQDGFPKEKIAQYTGLSYPEIEKLS